jgi:hypothetical protein
VDPKALGTAEWQQIAVSVNQFWFFAACLVIAALSFALAHATIPSLLTSRELSARASLARPVLYVISAIALVLAVVFIYRGVNMAGMIIREVYPRWLI